MLIPNAVLGEGPCVRAGGPARPSAAPPRDTTHPRHDVNPTPAECHLLAVALSPTGVEDRCYDDDELTVSEIHGILTKAGLPR